MNILWQNKPIILKLPKRRYILFLVGSSTKVFQELRCLNIFFSHFIHHCQMRNVVYSVSLHWFVTASYNDVLPKTVMIKQNCILSATNASHTPSYILFHFSPSHHEPLVSFLISISQSAFTYHQEHRKQT